VNVTAQLQQHEHRPVGAERPGGTSGAPGVDGPPSTTPDDGDGERDHASGAVRQPRLPFWARILDGLTILFACLLLSNLLFAGVKLRFGDTRITATSPLRHALLLLVLFGVRYWLVRSPTLWDRLSEWARRVWRSPVRAAVVPPFLASRAGVLAAGYLAVILIGYPTGAPPFRISRNEFVNLPMRWDAGWYLSIALEGYHFRTGSNRQQNVAFFPAYPMLTRVGAALLGAHGGRADSRDGLNAVEYAYHQHRRIVLAAMLISLVAFGWALVYLFRLAREMLDDDAAAGAVALACAYPFSLFYSAFYTESLFLLTVVGTFYHFRHRQWGPAAIWGLTLGLTRPNGCLISVPLALLALQQSLGGASEAWWRRGALAPVGDGVPASPENAAEGARSQVSFDLRRFWPGIAVASMPGIGMLLFSGYLYLRSGQPFAWLEAHRAWGRVYEGVGGLFAGHLNLVTELGLYQYSQNQPTEVLNGGASMVALLLAWPIARRLGLAFALFLLLMTVPPLAAGGFLSMGRVTATLFPIFLYLGWRLRGSNRASLVMACAALQGFLAAVYFTWRPIF
jgi:Mannosyltransferase (PIG-V)